MTQKTEQVNDEVVGTQKNQNPTTKPSINFEYKLFNLFRAIKHLDSINIKATQQGLEIWGMDATNTMMTTIKIDKDDFREYNFKNEFEIATEIDYLKIVKRFYMVKAYLDDEKMIFSEGKTKIEMPVFGSEREKPKPDFKKSVSFDLSTSEVKKTLKDIEAIQSDSFSIEFKDKSTTFTAQGKYGTLIKTLEPYEKGIKRFEKKEKDSIKVRLTTELFKDALNGLGSKMRITIGENSPVILESVEDEYTTLKEKVKHLVAPRSSEDY